ncbi:hypothetical protein LINPERPRIM_LOCUS2896 [Linum perenne]
MRICSRQQHLRQSHRTRSSRLLGLHSYAVGVFGRACLRRTFQSRRHSLRRLLPWLSHPPGT